MEKPSSGSATTTAANAENRRNDTLRSINNVTADQSPPRTSFAGSVATSGATTAAEDYPFDEGPGAAGSTTNNAGGAPVWQTEESMRALAKSNVEGSFIVSTEPAITSCCDGSSQTSSNMLPCPAIDQSCGGMMWGSAVAPYHPWDTSFEFPPPWLTMAPPPPPPPPPQQIRTVPSSPFANNRPGNQSYNPVLGGMVTTIGPPQMGVYRLRLPAALLPLLPVIVRRAEEHASQRPGGWRTRLYSLTQQDLAIADIPGGLGLAQAITEFVVQVVVTLFGGIHGTPAVVTPSPPAPDRLPQVRLDSNQPHILKYSCDDDSSGGGSRVEHAGRDSDDKSNNSRSGNTTGVPLHYDSCDVTVQLMLSDYRSGEYHGGGTVIPDVGGADAIVLEKGDILLHPGSLVHSGRDITRGTRYILLWFCDIMHG